jgi:hypothetical protein
LTFVYSDSTAVVGPLATVREPHSWDLCVKHGSRITAPRGWELVRHAGPLPTLPDEDDELVALADAVREGSTGAARTPVLVNGFVASDGFDDFSRAGGGATDAHLQRAGAHAGAPGGGVLAPPEHRSGRRRGHLRVLPDPGE